MQTVYVIYGIKRAYHDPVIGDFPERFRNISAHTSYSELLDKLREYNQNVEDYKDHDKKSWTERWDFDVIDFDTFRVKDAS